MKDISPAELGRLIQQGLHVTLATVNESAEFSRTPDGNSRIITFDLRLTNEQVFTVRVEEAH